MRGGDLVNGNLLQRRHTADCTFPISASEWAPEDAFTTPYDPATAEAKKNEPGAEDGEEGEGEGEHSDDDVDKSVHTVFVKNLNFDTTDGVSFRS